MSGVFISFEGIDFAGKSRLARILLNHLQESGYSNVDFIREPGGVDIAEEIRTILLNKKNTNLNERTELLLYSAARAQISSERILPSLAEGKIIIADRYVDSTTAYQGYGRNLDLEIINTINQFSTWSTLPHLTFLIDLPLAVARKRQQEQGIPQDRIEGAGQAFYEKVGQAYLKLARNESNRFVVLDGTQSVEILSNKINSTLRQKFELAV